MKSQRKCPPHRRQPADQPPASMTEANLHADKDSAYCSAHTLDNPLEENIVAIASSSPALPLSHSQNRIAREQKDRNTLEDKIRHAIDNWTAEEQATAYWYLYACGMTLERAKTLRHKAGFST